jgi:ubiquinone/menaquinone biosynthesis C-methylase UbiE
MPEMEAEKVIEAQRQDWNRVASAWEKWDEMLDRNMTFINYRLIGDARLHPGERVLDLGSGTGCPALLAAQAVGNQGSVVGLDLSEGMLAVARRKAKTLGLKNVTFQASDITRLTFDASSFDAVLSRFCLMFLPDIPKVVGQIARVLKPGAYFVAAVWSGPEKNPFIRIPMDVLKKFLPLPPPDPEQPGIFRLAEPNELLEICKQAGLHGLTDEEITAESYYASADEYYESLMDMAAPLQPLFAKLTSGQRKEADSEIKRVAGKFRVGHRIGLPMAIRVVAARKPY